MLRHINQLIVIFFLDFFRNNEWCENQNNSFKWLKWTLKNEMDPSMDRGGDIQIRIVMVTAIYDICLIMQSMRVEIPPKIYKIFFSQSILCPFRTLKYIFLRNNCCVTSMNRIGRYMRCKCCTNWKWISLIWFNLRWLWWRKSEFKIFYRMPRKFKIFQFFTEISIFNKFYQG